MDWKAHAHHWPMALHSKFVLCKPHIWHIQDAGTGPLLLLIHGAGGGTQSWRHLFPLLTKDHRVIAIDLPGQGFTKLGAQARCGLTEMAEDITELCRAQNWKPEALIGHSAGAAIALQMARNSPSATWPVIGINAALDNFKGLAGVLFPVMARTLAMMPMVADIFSATASREGAVQKLINGTGSQIDAKDLVFYQILFSDRSHVNATLQMMSQWNLDLLVQNFPTVNKQIHLIAGENDKAVPPSVSERASKILADASFELLPNLGHLAHEEDPQIVFEAIKEVL